MSRTKTLAVVICGALVVGALISPHALAKKKKKGPKSGPLVVGTDAAGDWGAATDPNFGPIGDALGQDLVEATIQPGAEAGTVEFVIKLNSLPPNGGAPEVSRYVWDMMVDGQFVELDGKWTNYSRGACDPTAGSCPPPRDPGLQPFLVRGNCAVGEGNVTTCEEIGLVTAVFDAAAATITIPVPLELLGAKPGSKIGPGTNIFGGTVSASPAAFVSSSGAPSDSLVALETYVVSAK